jgi:hypothetical protein
VTAGVQKKGVQKMEIKRVGTLAVVVMSSATLCALGPSETFSGQVQTMKIRLTVNRQAVTATLIDTATTRDFISLLPLTLTLEDYAGAEKIRVLPKRLSTEGALPGYNPSVGDIAYYAPWGNLAVFYRDSGYASGLVMLGKLDNSVAPFTVLGSLRVTIELVR